LDPKRKHVTARTGASIKGHIHATIREQAHEARQPLCGEIAERTSGKDLLVGLNGDGINRTISAGAGVEEGVDGAFNVDTRDAVPVRAGDLRKEATHKHFAVGLDCERTHRRIGTRADIEGVVEGTVGIQARETLPDNVVHVGEIASDHQAAIGHAISDVQSDCVNGPVGLSAAIKCCVKFSRRVVKRFVIHQGQIDAGRNTQERVNGIGELDANDFIPVTLRIIGKRHREGGAGLSGNQRKGA
jgi:hypothetical protein